MCGEGGFEGSRRYTAFLFCLMVSLSVVAPGHSQATPDSGRRAEALVPQSQVILQGVVADVSGHGMRRVLILTCLRSDSFDLTLWVISAPPGGEQHVQRIALDMLFAPENTSLH